MTANSGILYPRFYSLFTKLPLELPHLFLLPSRIKHSSFHSGIISLAGHNKWSKIKRDKGVNDTNKGTVFSKVTLSIISAVKACDGEIDPRHNLYLASALREAKEKQVPKSNIEAAIKKATAAGKDGVQLENVQYGALSSQGIAMIIEGLTENRNRTFTNLKTFLIKRAHGSIGEVDFLFRR